MAVDSSLRDSATDDRGSEAASIPMSGQRRAVRELARQALATNVGDRLPTATSLQEAANVGSGTIHKAFLILEDLGALQTRARGHMGRFLKDKDLSQLWGLSGFPRIRAILTPPGSPETYGLSEALTHEFSQLGLPLDIEYVIGARERASVASRSPFAMAFVSAGAATALKAPHRARGRVSLAPGSYYSEDSIVVLSTTDTDLRSQTIRVGVDRRSYDHKLLTVEAFGNLDSLKTVDVAFPDVPGALLRGDIDAGVWHRMLLVITPELAGLRVSELPDKARLLVDTLGSAVVLFDGGNPVMQSVISAVSWDSVVGFQRSWMKRFAKDPTGSWYR